MVFRKIAELRVNAAVNIIRDMNAKWAFQICSTIKTQYISNAGPLYFRKDARSRRTLFRSDHFCWFGYIRSVLESVHRLYKGVDKVDFVVEKKGDIFSEIRRLHDEYRLVLDESSPHLSRLLGEIIPGGKDRLPLQAADVLCWYSQRSVAGTLEGVDVGRYAALAERPGYWQQWSEEEVLQIAEGWRDPNAQI